MKSIPNNECKNIIDEMRSKGIPSVEQSGEFKGLPTIEELKLISMLSSTLCRKELLEITRRVGRPVFIKYKLIID